MHLNAFTMKCLGAVWIHAVEMVSVLAGWKGRWHHVGFPWNSHLIVQWPDALLGLVEEFGCERVPLSVGNGGTNSLGIVKINSVKCTVSWHSLLGVWPALQNIYKGQAVSSGSPSVRENLQSSVFLQLCRNRWALGETLVRLYLSSSDSASDHCSQTQKDGTETWLPWFKFKYVEFTAAPEEVLFCFHHFRLIKRVWLGREPLCLWHRTGTRKYPSFGLIHRAQETEGHRATM